MQSLFRSLLRFLSSKNLNLGTVILLFFAVLFVFSFRLVGFDFSFLSRAPPVYEERYELLVYNAKTWEIVGRYNDFEEHEVRPCSLIPLMSCVFFNPSNSPPLGCTVHEDGPPQGEDLFGRGNLKSTR
jgi:hypothetical protein